MWLAGGDGPSRESAAFPANASEKGASNRLAQDSGVARLLSSQHSTFNIPNGSWGIRSNTSVEPLLHMLQHNLSSSSVFIPLSSEALAFQETGVTCSPWLH